MAAESLGVNVYRMKYFAVIISGGFAGLGGAFLSIVAGNATARARPAAAASSASRP